MAGCRQCGQRVMVLGQTSHPANTWIPIVGVILILGIATWAWGK